jgi:YcaO-like protein with predicted kinase domain
MTHSFLTGLPPSFVRSERTRDLIDFAVANRITRVSSLTGLDSLGVPVWSAIRPDAIIWQVSAGKGFTNRAAITSTLMESVETICMEQSITSPGCIKYSPIASPVVDSSLIEKETKKLLGVFVPFYSKEVKYIPALELKSNNTVSVPEHWAYLSDASRKYGIVTNGLAAGYSDFMATSHALKEILERHFISSISTNGILHMNMLNKLDIKTLPKEFKFIQSRLHSCLLPQIFFKFVNGFYLVWVFLFDSNPLTQNLQVNFGSAFDLGLKSALHKAFFEVAQQRVSQIQGTREDLTDTSPFDYWKDITKIKNTITSIPFNNNYQSNFIHHNDLVLSSLLEEIPGYVFKISYQIPQKNIFAVKIIAPSAHFSSNLF